MRIKPISDEYNRETSGDACEALHQEDLGFRKQESAACDFARRALGLGF
jgi:hypothetical protein